ncbi:MAG: site-2 protease family protein [Candidatus Pacebacteria bacterium]|nr:site-2 protease family protein [Candidatus Paceibacterota bacterium]
MEIAIALFEFIVLIYSAILHEVAHGFEALHLGDDTAERAGRLTLNPLKHLDPFLSVIMPLLLFFTTGFFFAGAKPVPYNPNNLRNPRTDSVKVAFAGPVTNLLIALLFGILSVLLPISSAVKNGLWNAVASGGIPTLATAPERFFFLFLIIVYINIVLGIFNLVPIPPLDGSKVLFLVLPPTQTSYRIMYFLERWGLILVLIFVFFGYSVIFPVINALFAVFTGHIFGV